MPAKSYQFNLVLRSYQPLVSTDLHSQQNFDRDRSCACAHDSNLRVLGRLIPKTSARIHGRPFQSSVNHWRTPMKRISLLLAAAFLLALLPVVAAAQASSSSVRGIVTDPQSNPVAGANVTLANTERNFSRTQTTNTDGAYSFKPIPPGSYHLEVELKGFKKALITAVQALVDTPTDVNVQLEVGNVSETVNVASAGEAPINTTDA